MELKFKQSNIGCYQIVEYENKHYLLDTSTIAPKSYLLGSLPEKVTATMVEIDSEYKIFELKERNISTPVIAIIVQPFVKLGYDFLKEIFVTNEISNLLFFKLSLFIVPIILSFLIVFHSLFRAHRKVHARLKGPKQTLKIVFSTKRRFFENYVWVFFTGMLTYFYLTIDNGSEGALLVIVGAVLLLALITGWTMISIPTLYKRGNLQFDEIIKNE